MDGHWLEEPLDSRDYDGNAALKRNSKVKISGAELNLWMEGLLRKCGKHFFKINEFRLKVKVIREKGLKAALDIKKRKESG